MFYVIFSVSWLYISRFMKYIVINKLLLKYIRGIPQKKKPQAEACHATVRKFENTFPEKTHQHWFFIFLCRLTWIICRVRAKGRLIIQPGHYPLYRVSPHSAIQTLYSPLGVLVLALALALLRLLAVDGDVGVVLLLHRHDPLALQLDVIVIPTQKIF